MRRTWVALLSVVGGCAAVHRDDEMFLRLGIAEFNGAGTSWRSLESRRDYLGAARLLERYALRHPAVPEEELVLLHFHAAQEFAFAGDYERAVSHLPKAKYALEVNSFPVCWNHYVSATEAFLRQDRAALLAARSRIASGPKWNGEILGLNVVDSLIEHFGEPYLTAYMKAPKRQNQAPETTRGGVTSRGGLL